MLNENLINYVLGKDTSALEGKYMRMLRELYNEFAIENTVCKITLKEVLDKDFRILPTAKFNPGELEFLRKQSYFNFITYDIYSSNHGVPLFKFVSYLSINYCYSNKKLLAYFLNKRDSLTNDEMKYHQRIIEEFEFLVAYRKDYQEFIDENLQLKAEILSAHKDEFDSTLHNLNFGSYNWLVFGDKELVYVNQYINYLTTSVDSSMVTN